MKFQYTSTISTNTKGKLTKRPIVELELIGEKENINTLGLIDSGADTTMMNVEYAKVLGIDLSSANKKEFIGIGHSKVTTFISSVTMKVKYFDKTITTPVAFTDSPSVDILLGQEDFFEYFRIKFEKDHNTFNLSLSPKVKNL
ncbi:MAG: retropepsin-like aspartic protease [Candidatus Taylorbacteria bacterium]|nr:retropepsin-like aspartic protease [Candidatus Taylorbacteria bacterium]